MKLKLAVSLLILLGLGGSLRAQRTASNPLGGNLAVQDAGTCSTTGSFLWQTLPTNAGTTTLNLAGTFTATVTVRESNNGGGTWSTANTLSAVGTTTYSTNGFTDFCVDVTAFTSGSVAISISTGLQQVQSVVSGSSSGNGTGGTTNPAAPIMGFYLSSACPSTNTGSCFNTPANTQQANACAYTSGSGVVTCFGQVAQVTGSVTSNVATYTTTGSIPSNWAAGNSITISQFATAFLNTTCTISTVTPTTVTCPLVHANGSSPAGDTGEIANSNAGPFVAGDVNKRIFGYNTCRTSFDLSASNNLPMTTGTALTIASFQSSIQVTASGNAANTVTLSANNGGCVIWGTPDDAGAALVDAAAQVAPTCPRILFAAASYLFTVPHFTVSPTTCTGLGVDYPNGANFGNVVYAAGYELEGRGVGPTTWYLPPGFPETGSCSNGKSGLGCFVIVTEGRWTGIHITGGGNRLSSGMTNNQILVEMDGPASLDYVTLTNFGGALSVGGTRCVGAYGWAQIQQINISGCGGDQLATNTSSSVTVIRGWFENTGGTGAVQNHAINAGILTDYFTQTPTTFTKYNFICYDCTVSREGTVGSAGSNLVNDNGLAIKWYRGGISMVGGPGGQTTQGFLCASAGCVFDLEDTFADMSVGNLGVTSGINCTSSCTTYLKNSVVKGTATGVGYADVAGSTLFDLGGNTLNGPGPNTFHTLIADGHSVKAVCTGTATASSTLALISTGTSLTGTAITTACTGATLDKGIAVSGARTLENLTCTSSATTVSVACTVMTSHNGGAFASSGVTCTMTAATSCVDGTHSLVLADGDLVTIQIVTGAAETGANIKAIAEWN